MSKLATVVSGISFRSRARAQCEMNAILLHTLDKMGRRNMVAVFMGISGKNQVRHVQRPRRLQTADDKVTFKRLTRLAFLTLQKQLLEKTIRM